MWGSSVERALSLPSPLAHISMDLNAKALRVHYETHASLHILSIN